MRKWGPLSLFSRKAARYVRNSLDMPELRETILYVLAATEAPLLRKLVKESKCCE